MLIPPKKNDINKTTSLSPLNIYVTSVKIKHESINDIIRFIALGQAARTGSEK